MLNTDFLSTLADEIKTDFFILPSSVDELIAVPDFTDGSIETVMELKKMVESVNQEVVSEEEFLSNQIYRYSKDNEVSVVL